MALRKVLLSVPRRASLLIHRNVHHFFHAFTRERINRRKCLCWIVRIRMVVHTIGILYRNPGNDRMHRLIQVLPRLPEPLLLLLRRKLRIVDRHESPPSLDELLHRIEILTLEFLRRKERLKTFTKLKTDSGSRYLRDWRNGGYWESIGHFRHRRRWKRG
ncbi:hypothetical protein A3H22_00495 [Candidatus Peribacteria bacterium RIFCSPLOWO2_12_FULL_55_15]|nr:MAG: hypothetical protein A2789_02600 [Candidatus Peribacteria bacterium RIFCSPHIGHO2_01_FULL_54_22]OGJ62526.1 MAG: hypothetical protein A3D12_02330 [Candidatus Peribacteria bacterium RIFCSPHIGHO2_02_FULL_55_24]OGJ67429.1 MAG: hypothetical protein A2947_01570 [Candidatus Peribacteria bacterium RIFCSPLOWO2_01_FULL_54_110]OGJ69708.1 MAG: hypothetical protein A3H90_01410 [Candidatus Peribacteria bacterium RIFCSPLOWO2_02_FULL_55_36]OGJ70368.1 MAG: hypothetical protein A3H22_00495 [Candidatus Per